MNAIPINEVLFLKDTDLSYSMDKTQKYYSQWKEPDTKDHMLYDFI